MSHAEHLLWKKEIHLRHCQLLMNVCLSAGRAGDLQRGVERLLRMRRELPGEAFCRD